MLMIVRSVSGCSAYLAKHPGELFGVSEEAGYGIITAIIIGGLLIIIIPIILIIVYFRRT
jgi:hypothetical protein